MWDNQLKTETCKACASFVGLLDRMPIHPAPSFSPRLWNIVAVHLQASSYMSLWNDPSFSTVNKCLLLLLSIVRWLSVCSSFSHCNVFFSSVRSGVSCDACLKGNFRGRRYKCLICYDYDLCASCYESGATTTRHTTEHPMQCILTRVDFGK